MGDLSIDQIKARANQARDLFGMYIDYLVNAGDKRKARDTEINIFNLNDEYLDNKIDEIEGGKIKSGINAVNLNFLIDNKIITYNNITKSFSVGSGVIDVNNDGKRDGKDILALKYVLNYQGDGLVSLEGILGAAGNPDKLTEFYVKKWANERGMTEGTQEFTAFYNKFYNLYKNSKPKLDIPSLQKILRMYDLGLGQENINDIDAYIPAIFADIPFSVVINLFRFENSDIFDVTPAQKSAKRNSYISILSGTNVELKRVLSDALTRKIVPISGKELKVSTLDEVLNIVGDEVKTNQFIINQWADQNQLSGDERNIFVNKFFNTFFKAGGKNGLKLPELKALKEIYEDYKKVPGTVIDINKLDIYADGIKKNIPLASLRLIHKFEKTSAFNLTGIARENEINKYFEILTKKNQEVQSYLLQALRFNVIPFSKEPVTLENLRTFVDKISQKEGIIELNIDSWARERNFINLTSSINDDYDLFFNKFKEYAGRGITIPQLKDLVKIFDQAKLNIREINKLDIYATGIKKDIKTKHLMNLLKFEMSSDFEVPQNQRDIELNKFINILKDGTNNEKDILERTLANGKKVVYTDEEISVANINKALAEIKKPNGFAFLQFESFANIRKLSSTDRDIFVSKLKDWHVAQNPPKENYQLTVEQITSLLRLYDEKKLSLDQLDQYAQGLKNKVSFKDLLVVYKFEQGTTFKAQSSNRNLQIAEYINILKSTNNAKKAQMLNAMKTGKLPVTKEEMNLSKFAQILAKFDKEKELVEFYIETWSKNAENENSFFNKFMTYYNDTSFKLSFSHLSTLKSVYETNKDFNLENLDNYALAIKGGGNLANIRKIYSINSDDRFRGTQTQINRYLLILRAGSKEEKSVLNQTLKNNTIPHSGVKLIEKDKINLDDLDRILNLVKNEAELNQFIVGNMAKSIGLRENSAEYINYMNKFYQEYFISLKLPLSDIKALTNFYSVEKYSFQKLDVLANALKQGVKSIELSKYIQLAKKNKFTEEMFNRYLNILIGREGDAKKKIILEMIRTNRIPFSEIPL